VVFVSYRTGNRASLAVKARRLRKKIQEVGDGLARRERHTIRRIRGRNFLCECNLVRHGLSTDSVRVGRHKECEIRTDALPLTFIGAEKESLVLDDRAA